MKKLLPLLLLALLSACTPDDTTQEKAKPAVVAAPPDPAVAARQGLNDFLAASAPPVQVYRVPAGRPARVRGAGGTAVWVPAHAFATADGTAVTGPVDVELRECYSLAEMVLHGMATRAGKRLLATGGMVYLAARTPDGRECQLRPGVALGLLFPSFGPEPGMRLFGGRGTPGRGPATWALLPPVRATVVPPGVLVGPKAVFSTEGVVNRVEGYRWRCFQDPNNKLADAAYAAASRRQGPRAIQADSLAEVSGYLFDITQLDWINCDRFLREPTAPLVDYAVSTDQEPVFLSLVFKKFRGLLPGEPQGRRVVFANVPTGEPATLVAVRWVAGQIELATRAVTLDANLAPPLVFHPVTRAQLLTELQKLDPDHRWETPGTMPALPQPPCYMLL